MAQGHGGSRIRAGRKAGVVTTKTRAIADQAVKDGITPLEVMLGNMRHFQKVALDAEAVLEGLSAEELTGVELEPADQFKVLLAEVKKAAGLRQMAQDCARDAAPFIHPRLNGVDGKSGETEKPTSLADRLKAYAREDAIEASAGKVVELGKKARR